MWLKIKPEEPLIIGEVRAGSQFLTSLPFIPGRLLRGSWVERLLIQGETEILPKVQSIRIGNFFPTTEWRSMGYALPLPLTALTCKREGGFHSETYPQRRGHGIVDTLLPHLAYVLLQERGALFAAPFGITCLTCGSRMEPVSSFYTVYQNGGRSHYVRTRLQYHAQTKVSLSRHRRASTEGMLYTASALSPRSSSPDGSANEAPLVFLGRVYGDEKAVNDLCRAVNGAAIGALHTRGYGRIWVEEAEVRLPSLRERVEDFNKILKDLWADLRTLSVNDGDLPSKPEGLYFSVDLLSPAILRDPAGVPTLVLSLNLNGQTLTPVWYQARPDFAGGWAETWGLPKPTNLAVRMGSVYVFRWDGGLEELIAALGSVEIQGIGERCDESFGECLICHPFHQEIQER
jgi:CRISPR-associated protein Csx10